jgi:hypothetical protein
MGYRRRIYFTEKQKAEIWQRGHAHSFTTRCSPNGPNAYRRLRANLFTDPALRLTNLVVRRTRRRK